MSPASCSCGKAISPYSAIGLCRSCCSRQPRSAETKARMSAARLRLVADPDHRRRQAEATRAGVARAMTRPGESERRRQHGQQLGRAFGAANLGEAGSARRLANGRKSRAAKLAWCPLEYREQYRALRRMDLGAGEAKRMTLALIEADLRRFLATGELQQAHR